MAKRKSLSTATHGPALTKVSIQPPPFDDDPSPPSKRRASQRKVSQLKADTGSTNPNQNADVLDAPGALRASPDANEPDERFDLEKAGMDIEKQVKDEDSDESPLSALSDIEPPVEDKRAKLRGKVAEAASTGKKPEKAAKSKIAAASEPQFLDPEAEGDEEANEEELQAAMSRPPPVNSDYLPLPWKGRLGYVRTGLPYIYMKSTNETGLPLHISALLQPSGLQFEDLSDC